MKAFAASAPHQLANPKRLGTKASSLLLRLSLGFVSAAALGQSMSYGPLFAKGTNAQGLPIFMLICNRQRCIGVHGKTLGSPQDVARYVPAIPSELIERFGYQCWTLCRDPQGNIVGKPSPDYRNPFEKS